jgi:hypothetical protein
MIFVSHAWNKDQPDPQVMILVDLLIARGYDATCDVILQQHKTAIHFTEMMATSLRKAEN